MEMFFLCAMIFFFSLLILLFFRNREGYDQERGSKLPPGKMGLPFIGESLDYLSAGRKGKPENFIFSRLSKYGCTQIFKTSILGEKVGVMCCAVGNKFLFSNEDKLVQAWWPGSIHKLFPSYANTDTQQEATKMRKFLPTVFKPEALQRYIPIMDKVAIQHMEEEWEGKENVKVFELAKAYTFWLSCRIFVSIEDPVQVSKLGDKINYIMKGLISVPIDLPGTPLNRGIKAAKAVRRELMAIIKQRKLDLADNRASPTQDVLSHMLTTPYEDDRFMNELDIANKIMGLLIGGYETASTVCTFVVKFLADFPHIYDAVYKEQMEIAKSKEGEGEYYLKWEDMQKMKYSWNVACEVMRLVPPSQGAFREALSDFTYAGFHIPKGWKLYWSANSTHMNPKYFPEPEKFDPTRFEGSGSGPYTFVPFGGGPRMCAGKEYARLEILVFMHNLVKRFKWEKLVPDEKLEVNPFPYPSQGLPVRLHHHHHPHS